MRVCIHPLSPQRQRRSSSAELRSHSCEASDESFSTQHRHYVNHSTPHSSRSPFLPTLTRRGRWACIYNTNHLLPHTCAIALTPSSRHLVSTFPDSGYRSTHSSLNADSPIHSLPEDASLESAALMTHCHLSCHGIKSQGFIRKPSIAVGCVPLMCYLWILVTDSSHHHVFLVRGSLTHLLLHGLPC